MERSKGYVFLAMLVTFCRHRCWGNSGGDFGNFFFPLGGVFSRCHVALGGGIGCLISFL
jgi:hypothetical protein